MLRFLRPLTTGDVWWQDGQIKEEEEEYTGGTSPLGNGLYLDIAEYWSMGVMSPLGNGLHLDRAEGNGLHMDRAEYWSTERMSTLCHVRGVLGNKCAGQQNLKRVKIREIMWK